MRHQVTAHWPACDDHVPIYPMLRLNHIFALELKNAQGEVLRQLPVAPNWEAVTEWARFEAMRHARVEQWSALAAADAEILPTCNGRGPYAEGFRVLIHSDQAAHLEGDVPLSWFSRLAQSASIDLIKDGKLSHESQPIFRLLAFEPSEIPKVQSATFDVEELPAPPPVLQVELAGLMTGSLLVGEPDLTDFPVFVPQQILDEAARQTLAADLEETGGVLLGCLVNDRVAQETGLVITALIPALHTDAKCESLTFTAETWSAVSTAVTLRNRPGEMICGWHHSHPSKYWCLGCPAERRLICPLQREGFLSAHDLTVHETLFPKPFQLALLTTNAETGLRHALFGTWQGQMRQRSFYQMRAPFPNPSGAKREFATSNSEPEIGTTL